MENQQLNLGLPPSGSSPIKSPNRKFRLANNPNGIQQLHVPLTINHVSNKTGLMNQINFLSTNGTTISQNSLKGNQRINSPNPNSVDQQGYHHKGRNNFHSSDRAGEFIAGETPPQDIGPIGVVNQYIQSQNLAPVSILQEGDPASRSSLDQKISMASRNGKLKITRSPAPPNDGSLLPTIHYTPQVTSNKGFLMQNIQTSSNSQSRQQNQMSPNLQSTGAQIIQNQRYKTNPNTTNVKSRAESGDAINNTGSALLQMALAQNKNLNLQFEHDEQRRNSLKDQGLTDNFQQGVVSATKETRTGLIHKTSEKKLYQPFNFKPRERNNSEKNENTSFKTPTPMMTTECSIEIFSSDSSTRGHSKKRFLGGGIKLKNNAPFKIRALSKNSDKNDNRKVEEIINSCQSDTEQSVQIAQTDRELPKIKLKQGGKIAMLKNSSNIAGQPFDFKYIKVLIKKGSGDNKEIKEVFIDRKWVQKNNNVPHFANVIKKVNQNEGVEITMNCNGDAFSWIMDFVKIKTDGDEIIEEMVANSDYPSLIAMQTVKDETDTAIYDKLDEVDNDNCLNIMVTAYFLHLSWVYTKVWDYYFCRNFHEVINDCKISLSNINQAIVRDIANRINDESLEKITERKDKFVSNVYKARIDQQIISGPDVSDFIVVTPNNNPLESKAQARQQNLYWCEKCQNILTQDQAMKISCKPGTEEFYSQNGDAYYTHEIIFVEEVPFLASLKILERESPESISSTQPIHIENFVKFIREKYRLCWKEIYLKFGSLNFKPEQCKFCRQWFQISQIAGCNGKFHEIDFNQEEIISQNLFSKSHYEIYKSQFQVTDNIKESKIAEIMSQYEGQITFIEPQSMNFEIKISQAYIEFLEQQKMNTGLPNSVITYGSKSGIQLFNEKGQKLETMDEQFDDQIVRSAKHQKKIEQRLKDHKFMKRLQNECEEYVKANPEEFKQIGHAQKFKFDIEENKMTETKSKKKGSLDFQQAAHVQALVIKKFKRIRKDIIREEDANSQIVLSGLLQQVRCLPQDESKFKSQQSIGKLRGMSPASGLQRHRSPAGPNKNPNLENMACDLSSQAGVKIYSDIKQITVKKKIVMKIVATGNTTGPRKNFLQRNIARSQGARSGSNQGQATSVEPPQKQLQQPITAVNSASKIQSTMASPQPLNQNNVFQRHGNSVMQSLELQPNNGSLTNFTTNDKNRMRSPNISGGLHVPNMSTTANILNQRTSGNPIPPVSITGQTVLRATRSPGIRIKASKLDGQILQKIQNVQNQGQ